MAAFVPERGDIVWLEFDPQAGHRPALVLTPAAYNAQRGMAICCLLSSKIKGYVLEVIVSADPPSVVLADQVKSLDWRARKATKKGVVSALVLAEVQAKIKALIGF